MKTSALLLLVAALCSVSDAALFSKSSKVALLDASNFKREVLDIEKPTMVAFTAPWCGHCQKLVPDYTKVANQLDGVVKLAAIDCDEEKNKPLCGKYGIQGFPTLKLFPSTKKRLPKDYQGARAAKEIAAYMIDSLPMGAKKLKAEELQQYTDLDPDTPKIVLFSKKPTSSPLYKSLALDFRQSLSFAFLRGDQQPVRSAARVHLGVDVDESKLPLLIAVPARREGDDFDKTQVKTYTGALKYHELNKWIKDVLPEAAAGKKRKASKQPASRSQPQRKKPVKLDEEIEELPTGAQREWRVEEEMNDEERLAKMQKLADMINEAAQKKAEEAGEQVEDTVAQVKDKAGDVRKSASKKVDDVKQAASETAEQVSEAIADQAAKVGSAAQERVQSAKQAVFEAAGKASGYVRDTVDQVKGSAQDTASEKLENVKQTAADAAQQANYAVKDTAGDYKVTAQDTVAQAYKSVKQNLVDPNSKESLKESVQKWLEGENVDWSKDYASKFDEAQKEAEELIRSDPKKAEMMAAEGEQWLADHLYSDIELMRLAREAGNTNPSLDDDKFERVQGMYDELLKRIKDRKDRLNSKPHDEL